MIDIHNHILQDMDDGSRNIEESVEILKELSLIGYKEVILTPHYIVGTKYTKNVLEKQKYMMELQKKVAEENIPIRICPGNEIYIDWDIVDLIEKKEIESLNHSKYLLIELPMNTYYNGMMDVIYKLRQNGFIPILAHPERYQIFKDNPKLAEDVLNSGILFQGNLGSIAGFHGKESKKLLSLFLKHKMIHFLGSDIHRKQSKTFLNFDLIKKKILKEIHQEEFRRLTEDNPRCVIENKSIPEEKYIPLKQTIFKRYK